MSQVSYDPDPDVVRELMEAGVNFSRFRFPEELEVLLAEKPADDEEAAPLTIDVTTTCPKCGHRFDPKKPTMAAKKKR